MPLSPSEVADRERSHTPPFPDSWHAELQSLLTADEYKEARASTLNAFYTSPTVIKAMYEALGNMGYRSTYVEQLQAQGYPIRWIDETK